MFDNIEDYVNSTGLCVNESFRMGWHMARLGKRHVDRNKNFIVELSGEYHTDCNLIMAEIERLRDSIIKNMLSDESLEGDVQLIVKPPKGVIR